MVRQCLLTPRAAKARGLQTPHWFASWGGRPEGARVAQAPGGCSALWRKKACCSPEEVSAYTCVFFLILIV